MNVKKWNRKSWNKMKAGIKAYEKKVDAGEIDEGPVWTVIRAARCQSKRRFPEDAQCCGVKGHKGLHWRYSEDGPLHQWPNRKGLKPWSMAYSMTPPGHQNYIHPKDKAADYHMHHNRSVQVKARRRKRDRAQASQ
jgi:hypothetical protein